MIGDLIEDEGITYEVVWSGGEGLVGIRESRLVGPPAHRVYNKTGRYSANKPTPQPQPDPKEPE